MPAKTRMPSTGWVNAWSRRSVTVSSAEPRALRPPTLSSITCSAQSSSDGKAAGSRPAAVGRAVAALPEPEQAAEDLAQLGEACAAARHQGDHRAAEERRQRGASKVRPRRCARSTMLRATTGGNAHLRQLGDQHQVARQVGGVEHDERQVRRAGCRLAQEDRAADPRFGQVEVEAVDSRQVDDLDRQGAGLGAAAAPARRSWCRGNWTSWLRTPQRRLKTVVLPVFGLPSSAMRGAAPAGVGARSEAVWTADIGG